MEQLKYVNSTIALKPISRVYASLDPKKLWTQSYFVETIGNTNEETIRKYVQNQLLEMDKVEKKAVQLKFF
ncbi:MAG: transposase [Alphaproteobacteria bacterium]